MVNGRTSFRRSSCMFLCILVFCAIVLGVVSCDMASVPYEAELDQRKIQISVTIEDAEDAVANGLGRLVTTPGLVSSFSPGDRIGVFAYAYHSDGISVDTGSYYSGMRNICFEYRSDGTWATVDGNDYFYPSGGGKLAFYAYYPYDNSFTDPTAITVTANADQSTASRYYASDFLYGSALDKTFGQKVQFTFSHAMALLQLRFNANGYGKDKDKIVVSMEDFYSQSTIDILSGASVGGTGSLADTVVFYPADLSFDATDNMYYYTAWLNVPKQNITVPKSFEITYEGYIYQGNITKVGNATDGYVSSGTRLLDGGKVTQLAGTLPIPDNPYEATDNLVQYRWEIDDDNLYFYRTYSPGSTVATLVIPAMLGKRNEATFHNLYMVPVRKISDNFKKNATGLTNLYLPYSLKELGATAFGYDSAGVSMLASVFIGDDGNGSKLERIGSSAFKNNTVLSTVFLYPQKEGSETVGTIPTLDTNAFSGAGTGGMTIFVSKAQQVVDVLNEAVNVGLKGWAAVPVVAGASLVSGGSLALQSLAGSAGIVTLRAVL